MNHLYRRNFWTLPVLFGLLLAGNGLGAVRADDGPSSSGRRSRSTSN